MTLLVEVMQHPLDPGYEAAARLKAQRQEQGRPGRGPVSLLITLLVAVVCGWVTTTSVMELRRPQPEAIQARASLEKEIEQRTVEVDRRQKANEDLRTRIAAAQQTALAADSSSTMVAQSRNLALVTGELPVVGPGLEFTVDDAPGTDIPGGTDPRQSGGPDQGRVLDRDLQVIVNGLWAAGAEAISINGERLTALSAIRAAGQAILVDFRPLSPPYVIDAIGDAKRLQSGFGEDFAGAYLKSLSSNYGIRAGMAAKPAMTVPGAGSLSLHHATTPDAAASATAEPGAEPTAPSSGATSSSHPSGNPSRTSDTTSSRTPSPSGTSSGGVTAAPTAFVPPSSAPPSNGTAVRTQEVSA